MAYNFEGQNILITGAGRGIGRGIATNLAKLGATVYALDSIKENLDDLEKETPGIVQIHHDLANWDETVKVVGILGTLNGLVNCAGVLGKQQSVFG